MQWWLEHNPDGKKEDFEAKKEELIAACCEITTKLFGAKADERSVMMYVTGAERRKGLRSGKRFRSQAGSGSEEESEPEMVSRAKLSLTFVG